jgi:hypothetical protein
VFLLQLLLSLREAGLFTFKSKQLQAQGFSSGFLKNLMRCELPRVGEM